MKFKFGLPTLPSPTKSLKSKLSRNKLEDQTFNSIMNFEYKNSTNFKIKSVLLLSLLSVCYFVEIVRKAKIGLVVFR
jgi:hypothetical protein